MIVRDIITIVNGDIVLTGKGDVWMTCEEIADLFDVLGSSVRRATKGIISEVKSLPLGNGYYADLFNLEVIIMLAHKLDTANTKVFRKWLAEKLSDYVCGRKPCVIIDFRTGIRY